MKTTKFFAMAALALMTIASCSTEDFDQPQQPAETIIEPAGEITITATLDAKSNGEGMRAVADGGTTITSEWAVDEEIAILFDVSGTPTKRIATVQSVTAGVATIQFTVPAETAENAAATLVYPASAAKADNSGVDTYANLLAAQDGTLSANLDVRVGAGTIQVATPGLTVTTQPAAQFAIFKFTLSGVSIDATHPLVVKNGTSNKTITTVTPASTATSVYAAMPAATSTTYKFVVDNNDNKYLKSGTATIAAGKYYQTTLAMVARYPLAMANATIDDLGSLLGQDGNIYATKDAATTAGTTAVAKIIYVGSSTGDATYNHGLALALADEGVGGMNWNTAISTCSGKNTSLAVTGASWMLASKDQWNTMISAAGNRATLRDGFSSVGGTNMESARYWSSTEWEYNANNAWACLFNTAGWEDNNKGYTYIKVRACLAF